MLGGVREEVNLPRRHPLRPYRPTLVAPCGEPTHSTTQEVTKAPLGFYRCVGLQGMSMGRGSRTLHLPMGKVLLGIKPDVSL